jgi:hypothetical protein
MQSQTVQIHSQTKKDITCELHLDSVGKYKVYRGVGAGLNLQQGRCPSEKRNAVHCQFQD